jgi:Skp family chaperone for outer membrane proteins
MNKSFIIAALASWLVATPAFAQQFVGAPTLTAVKIATINFQRLAGESTEGKAAAAKVQSLTQQRTAELKEKAKTLEGLKQELAKSDQASSEAARLKTQREIDRLTVDIERFKQDASKEIQALQQGLFQTIQEQLNPILETVIKEQGIHVLFNAANMPTVFVNSALDITQDVINRLNDAGKTAAPAKK